MVAGNYSEESATYDSDDIDDIVVDGLGTAGVAAIGFATLIVLSMVLLYLKKHWRF